MIKPDNEHFMVRIRMEDPYAILGVCLYLSECGYHIPNFYFMGKMNSFSILRLAKLNKWIDVLPLWKMAHVECGDISEEEAANQDTEGNQIIFKTPDELIQYLRDNEFL